MRKIKYVLSCLVLTVAAFTSSQALAARSCRGDFALRPPGPITAPLKRVHFAVMGVGDVVRLFYLPAFQRLINTYAERGHEIAVSFLDRSEFWQSNPDLAAKMQKIIGDVKGIGARYVDQSGLSPQGVKNLWRELQPDAVIIATPDVTHMNLAGQWLDLATETNHWPQIFVEKPFGVNPNETFQLVGRAKNHPGQIWAFDHFRATALLSNENKQSIFRHLGALTQYHFFLVEDHSSADPHYPRAFNRDGAIENEGRTKALNNGLILDLLSHMPPLVADFGFIRTLGLKWLRAGQYVGVDGDPLRRAGIQGETFAEVGFDFIDFNGQPIQGVAWVGKGVGGVRRLGAGFEHEALAVELIGQNGRRVLLNLLPSKDGKFPARAIFYDENGQEVAGGFPLHSQPFFHFVESILLGNYSQRRLVLDPEEGHRIVATLDEWRSPVTARLQSGLELPTYSGGMSTRASLPVEDIQLSPLWGAPDRP